MAPKAKKSIKAKPRAKVNVKAKPKAKASIKTKAKANTKTKPKAKIQAKSKLSAKLKAKAKTTSKAKPAKATKKAPAKLKVKKQKTAIAKVNSAKTKAVKSKLTVASKGKSSASLISTSLHEVITPLDDRIIVEVQAGERMTAGGLFIPETAQMSGNKKGTILATGRGHKDQKGRLRPLDVKVGDTVVFGEFSGTKLELLGQSFLILRETDILGVVE